MKIKKEHLKGLDAARGDKVRFVKREENGERWSELDGLEIGKEYVVRDASNDYICITSFYVPKECFVIV